VKTCPQFDASRIRHRPARTVDRAIEDPAGLIGTPRSSISRRTRAAGLLAAVMSFATLQGMPQQDDGPILLPTPKPKPAPSATLLVICDLACNWKLDGVAQGRIEAEGSAKAKVGIGQHLVVAITEDGLDKADKEFDIRSTGQTLARLDLAPVRDARLKTEQQLREIAAQQMRQKNAQEARDKAARQAREKAALQDADKIWTDPATRLMWTKKDNGSDVNWQKAGSYCRNLRLAGYSDWRLPSIDDLTGIYDPSANVDGEQGRGNRATWHVKGKLQLSGYSWSSSQGNSAWEEWIFFFSNGARYSSPLLGSGLDRALCVRRAGQ
jgi:hypothetical protein